MRQLNDIGAALLVGAGQLAVALPVRIALGRLLDAFRRADIATAYVRKEHLPHRPYAGRIEPTGPAGRHRLTLANRRTAYRPVVGHVRHHGHPDDVAPRAVTAGIWTEEAD